MKPSIDIQELARRFNEDEAVSQRFEERRRARDSASLIPDELLDEIDWREAEEEVRVTQCVGKVLTSDL